MVNAANAATANAATARTAARAVIPIDKISSGTKPQPRLLEWLDGHWRLWLSYNRAMTAGTYLVLTDDAQVLRFVQEPDGTIADVVIVKGKN